VSIFQTNQVTKSFFRRNPPFRVICCFTKNLEFIVKWRRWYDKCVLTKFPFTAANKILHRQTKHVHACMYSPFHFRFITLNQHRSWQCRFDAPLPTFNLYKINVHFVISRYQIYLELRNTLTSAWIFKNKNISFVFQVKKFQSTQVYLRTCWWPGEVKPQPGHQEAASSVHYTTSCKNSLVLLRMGGIIVRNMLSWLKLSIKLLLLHLVTCLYYCINDARSHKHQIRVLCLSRFK